MAAADRARRKQHGKCAQARFLCTAEGVFFLLCCAGWLWLGARTLCAAKRILACQQFGRACFHAAGVWQGLERLQRR